MTPILFRCDASLAIGSGHVMRCRTLARELQRRGAAITFICQRQPGDLIALLRNEFPVVELPDQPLAACEGLKGRALYGAWLGHSQAQDVAQCQEALQEAGITSASWLVVDHYGLDASWESQLLSWLASEAPPRLLVIDDLADRQHLADVLLDQNFLGDGTESRYQGLVPPRCLQLLGPHYALLGPEYAQLHPLVPARKELRRVLVFFGGVDPTNLTGQALEALMAPELADLAVDVVLGRQSPHREAVAALAARRPHTSLHAPQASLAGLIARADLAIGGGGATTWERACLRLPTMVVTMAANQKPFVEALAQAGSLQLLGEADFIAPQQIRSALLWRTAEPFQSESGAALTDGWGAPRLATAMLGIQAAAMRVRQATAADEALLLRWANDPQVRAHSFRPELIAAAEHHSWFQRGLLDANRLSLIALGPEGCPIGQIRFDRRTVSAAEPTSEATIGLSLDRCVRGHGLASELVRLGLLAMEQRWGPDTEAVAEVLTSNAASNACFARAGFEAEPDGVHATPSRSVNRWRWRATPNSRI